MGLRDFFRRRFQVRRENRLERGSMQRVPSVTHDDVERVTRRDFPSEAVETVLAVLRQYGDQDSPGTHHRVHLAALKLAHGDLEELREHVRIAKLDYRDVLAAAEYPEASTRWPVMDKMSDEARQKIYAADWEQYRAWLERK